MPRQKYQYTFVPSRMVRKLDLPESVQFCQCAEDDCDNEPTLYEFVIERAIVTVDDHLIRLDRTAIPGDIGRQIQEVIRGLRLRDCCTRWSSTERALRVRSCPCIRE